MSEELAFLSLTEAAARIRAGELSPVAYTQALLGANPVNDPTERRPLQVLQGDPPSPFNPPSGCPFVGRCPLAEARCAEERPVLEEVAPGQRVACWLTA